MASAKYAILAGFVVAMTLVSAVMIPYLIVPKQTGKNELKYFISYNELKNYIETNTKEANYWFGMLGGGVAVMTGVSPSSQKIENTPNYSTTNVQVEGVDESDVVKNDGNYIYFIRQNQFNGGGEVIILKAYPVEDAKTLSRINWTQNKLPTSIFVNKDKLIVFLSIWDNVGTAQSKGYQYFSQPKMAIEVYDIQNREKPKLANNITLEGFYLNSRMIGNYVYVVTSFPTYVNGDIKLPTIFLNGRKETIQPNEISYPDTPDTTYSFTTILSFNTQNDQEEPISKTILTGAASNIYASSENIYLTLTKYDFQEYRQINSNFEQTLIYRVHIDNGEIKLEAEGSVPGHVLDQFSMDEYNDSFRIVTTVGQNWMASAGALQSNSIYILDNSLKVVGKIENIASGEKIYSARFMVEKAYMVTFKKVDPFFIIDVKDPSNPKILGWLKIPGYSNYLHPIDNNHILGIGKEAVDAEGGDFAWYQGIKLSLFNVTDVSEPVEASKYIIGERGTDSPVLSDHKALLFDSSKNLMVMPILVCEIDRNQYPGEVPVNAYGQPVWQGVYVFNVTTDKGIVFRGNITHYDEGFNNQYNGFGSIERALYIGDYLYTISNGMIKINNIISLAQIAEIKLP
jgi:inhibitor of cysteine peptidase